MIGPRPPSHHEEVLAGDVVGGEYLVPEIAGSRRDERGGLMGGLLELVNPRRIDGQPGGLDDHGNTARR